MTNENDHKTAHGRAHHGPKSEDSSKEVEKVVKNQQDRSMKFSTYVVLLIIVIFAGVFLMRLFFTPKEIIVENPDEPIMRVYNGFNCTSYDDFHNCLFYIQENGKWYDYEFRDAPWNLEYIPSDGDIKPLVDKSVVEQIYITFPGNLDEKLQNAQMAIATYQVGRFFGDQFDFLIPTNAAIIPGTDINGLSEHVPLIDCKNATESTPVILFQYGDSTKLSVNNNCYIVQGTDGEEVIKAADRLSYTFLGIMK